LEEEQPILSDLDVDIGIESMRNLTIEIVGALELTFGKTILEIRFRMPCPACFRRKQFGCRCASVAWFCRRKRSDYFLGAKLRAGTYSARDIVIIAFRQAFHAWLYNLTLFVEGIPLE